MSSLTIKNLNKIYNPGKNEVHAVKDGLDGVDGDSAGRQFANAVIVDGIRGLMPCSDWHIGSQ